MKTLPQSNHTSPMVSAPVNGTPLSMTQIIISALFGASLWFLAAMIVRALGPIGALAGVTRMITYALVIPGTVPAVIMGQKLARLARGQILPGVAVMTMTALLLDGVAFAWFPALYSRDPAILIAGAAVILWGAGIGLVIGFVMDSRPAV
jgi:hypothetical protein